MPVDLRHIRAFHAVAEAMHFRRASERLGIAQPALSRTIKDLEEAMQVSLFERTTRLTRLTESGRIFLRHTSHLAADLDRAIDLAQQTHSGLAGELRVSFNDPAISGLLPEIVRRFRTETENVEVALVGSNSPHAIEMLLDNKLDVAFATDQHIPPELDEILVRHERLVCVLPASHPLVRQTSVSITDLAEEPFVMGDWENWKGSYRLLRKFCGEYGFSPKVVQEAERTDGILGLVAAEMGVTVHFDNDWIHTLKGVAVRPIRERHPKTWTSAIWSRRRRASSVALDMFVQSTMTVVSEEGTAPNSPLDAKDNRVRLSA